MKFELVIDSRSTEVVIALLKEGRLIELHKEKHDNDYSVGDIYLGKVKKIVPGLNASFINVGHEKDGFLHYLDLGSQVNSFKKFTDKTRDKKLNTASLKNFRREKDTLKDGKIQEVLKSGDQILVQVSKEPISSKGPRLSTELSFAGRYMVLIPFSDRVSISQKIRSSEERSRLKKLIHSIKPKGFGVIIRTVAEGKKVAELDRDMKNLYKKWQSIFGISDWQIKTERILPEQIEYSGETYFIAIERDFDKKEGTIYHDIDLCEESIVHELLHIKNPEKDEDWVNAKTNQLLKL